MAEVTLSGTPVQLAGSFPQVGDKLADFTLINKELTEVKLAAFQGKRIIINTFPSIDTGICALGVKRFNQQASQLPNTVIITVSNDLPFALGRFCGNEGIENVQTLSAFRSDFGDVYGVRMLDGALAGLLARAIIIADEQGTIIYTELVPEIKTEPNYEQAFNVL